MNDNTAQVILAVAFMALLGVVCLAIHSAEPLWLLVLLMFFLAG